MTCYHCGIRIITKSVNGEFCSIRCFKDWQEGIREEIKKDVCPLCKAVGKHECYEVLCVAKM